jgi:HK97 family phage major capsid protein
MSASEIKALLDEQGRVFEAFKAAFEEKHGRNVEEIGKLNGELDRLADRIDETRAVMRRSATAEAADEVLRSPERKAFARFLKQGKEHVGPEELKVLLLADDTAGGYLAPSEMVHEIIKGEAELSPMRQVARVRQTTARTLEIPRRSGQFSAVWTGEIEVRAETEGLAWGLEEIPTHELTAEVYLSQQMLEDAAVDIELELTEEFAERFAVAEGAAVVAGNGVKKPEGFLDHADVAETPSGSAAGIADPDGQANGLIDLYHGVKTAYARNGTWLLNRFTLGEVRKLKDANDAYVWQPGLSEGVPNTILGAPYVEVPDMPDVAADSYPIAFGDWRRAYVIVDRITMSVLRDPFTRGSQGQVKFLARRRVGGQVVLAEAIRKLKVGI